MVKRFKSISSFQGFTLVEVATVFIIGGLLIGMFGTGLSAYIQKARVDQVQQKLEIIRDAIEQYTVSNGKLPCPASYTDAIDSANFGFRFPGLPVDLF